MIPKFLRQRSFVLISGLAILAAATTGCVSRKPLPYQFGEARPAPTQGPALALAPTKSSRVAKDKMDKALELPACIDTVLIKELESSGVFKTVTLNTNGSASAEYQLEPSLVELRWEVPDYNKIMGTTFVVSFFTGGVGGLAYTATGTEVLGHATLRIKLVDSRSKLVLLERDYQATAKDNRAKLNCDTAKTYREMAASALKEAITHLKHDLQQLDFAKQRSAPPI